MSATNFNDNVQISNSNLLNAIKSNLFKIEKSEENQLQQSTSKLQKIESFLSVKAANNESRDQAQPNWKRLIKNGRIKIAVDGFGAIRNAISGEMEIVKRYTFVNRNKMTVQVITYGATITSIKMPNKYGFVEDILMGFDDLEGYQSDKNPNFGSTIGRVVFTINNDEKNSKTRFKQYDVCFEKSNWTSDVNEGILNLTHVSRNNNGGPDGCVIVTASFQLTDDNKFLVKYSATTSTPTCINLSNNLYFNLAGHASQYEELFKHILTLNAEKYVPCTSSKLKQYVNGTIFDLRVPREMGPAIARVQQIQAVKGSVDFSHNEGGYNHYFYLAKGSEQTITFVGRVLHPSSGRFLEIYTDQPGFQFYTANKLADPCRNINPRELYTQQYYDIKDHPNIANITSSHSKCSELYSLKSADSKKLDNCLPEFSSMSLFIKESQLASRSSQFYSNQFKQDSSRNNNSDEINKSENDCSTKSFIKTMVIQSIDSINERIMPGQKSNSSMNELKGLSRLSTNSIKQSIESRTSLKSEDSCQCSQPDLVDVLSTDESMQHNAIVGKKGGLYMRHGAFCLNAQHCPVEVFDKDNFSKILLYPGKSYRHEISYKFGLNEPMVESESDESSEDEGYEFEINDEDGGEEGAVEQDDEFQSEDASIEEVI